MCKLFEDSEGSNKDDISEQVTLKLDWDAGASEGQNKSTDWNELVLIGALMDARPDIE